MYIFVVNKAAKSTNRRQVCFGTYRKYARVYMFPTSGAQSMKTACNFRHRTLMNSNLFDETPYFYQFGGHNVVEHYTMLHFVNRNRI